MRLPIMASLALVLLFAASTPALAQERVRVFGDRYRHPQDDKEFVRTYVDMPKDHDGNTVPLAIGMQFTPGFIRMSDDLPITWNYTANVPQGVGLDVPGHGNVTTDEESFPMMTFENYEIKFPQVGLNPYPFATLTYNFYGHPPIGVYDAQHYDVRFFMVTPEWWWKDQYDWDKAPTTSPCGNEYGVEAMYRANLPIPEECWPGDPMVYQNVGHYTYAVGTHIYNMLEPGWQAWASGSGVGDVNSLTWGMQDGQIAYIETMFSRNDALEADLNQCVDFSDSIPKHFDTERWVPTRRCMVAGPSNIKLEYDKFVKVPGGCQEIRNSTDVNLVGWFPPDLVASVYGPECKVPEP